ncbi:FadR/GntR family transcriptional regulator [Microbacterium pygmaeum]|uniref:DNA-binding transcriptional regulator, FadR family n=1 Tax=Microbacterium pygmaeum TaxID=370764 RepID=A0A1G7XK06_9MICO|nr:FadR/GntR family transcriptional regulator [Microbacterium pygmaeum]SDG84569.1 DNA-binding transcriptional regulator, FadR family [Microbacterium pygmaeum]
MVDKIRAPKSFDLLAQRLREAILSGEIAEGDSLPPERELVEQTGLTRGSVREALKQLSAEGLVQTRPGRFGGNTVTLPGKDIMTNSLNQFVRGRRMPLRTLNETREVLEPALARLAAVHRTEDDLARIRRLHDDLVAASGDFHQFSRVNVKWHNAVAAASGNDVLSAVLEALSFGVTVSTTVDAYDTEDTRQQVIRVHSKIVEAIEQHDGERAERHMRQHLGATHARVAGTKSADVPLSSPSAVENV